MGDTELFKEVHEFPLHAQPPLEHFKKAERDARRSVLHRPEVGQRVYPTPTKPFKVEADKRLEVVVP